MGLFCQELREWARIFFVFAALPGILLSTWFFFKQEGMGAICFLSIFQN